jgi:hypothetical protein
VNTQPLHVRLGVRLQVRRQRHGRHLGQRHHPRRPAPVLGGLTMILPATSAACSTTWTRAPSRSTWRRLSTDDGRGGSGPPPPGPGAPGRAARPAWAGTRCPAPPPGPLGGRTATRSPPGSTRSPAGAGTLRYGPDRPSYTTRSGPARTQRASAPVVINDERGSPGADDPRQLGQARFAARPEEVGEPRMGHSHHMVGEHQLLRRPG